MMKYIILAEHEISQDLKSRINLSSTKKLIPISDTGFYYIAVADYENDDVLIKYKKFDSESLKAAKDAIKFNQSVDRIHRDVTKNSAFPSAEGRRARLQGAFKMTIAAGDTVSQEFVIAQDRLITGAVYKGFNTNFGDKVDFEIVHPAYGPIDNFADNWYVSDDLVSQGLYPAKLSAGLKIKITYYNVGNQEAKFFCNLLLHQV